MADVRVLWITNLANSDPRSGGGLRSLRLVQAISGDWPVDVVNVGGGLDVPAYLRVSGAATTTAVPPDTHSRRRLAAMAVTRRLPLPVCRLHSAQISARVNEAAARGDVIALESGVMLGYLPAQGRLLAVLQNVDSEIARQTAAGGRHKLERFWNVRTYESLQRRLGHRPESAVSVVSKRDADEMGLRATVIPNGADLPSSVAPLTVDGPVVFIGSMGYGPNVEAVHWWTEQVWPGSHLPPLTVIGQAATDALSHLRSSAAVSIVGEVSDVTPWLRRAAIVAVPILSGSGTRLKVVEALAHGRPVVSTSKGAEGIGAVHGRDLLLADTAEDFAAAIARLRRDPELMAVLSRNGRTLAETMSWPVIGARFRESIAEVL